MSRRPATENIMILFYWNFNACLTCAPTQLHGLSSQSNLKINKLKKPKRGE
jgi:hypothetical protein